MVEEYLQIFAMTNQNKLNYSIKSCDNIKNYNHELNNY